MLKITIGGSLSGLLAWIALSSQSNFWSKTAPYRNSSAQRAWFCVDAATLHSHARCVRKRFKLGESNAVFLRGVGGDAATERHKTGCSGYPEEEFSGTHKPAKQEPAEPLSGDGDLQ